MADTTVLTAPDRAGIRRRPGAPPAQAGDALSAVAWRARQDLAFRDWVEQGRKLGVLGRSAGWWIGDWLNYGNSVYGERYARAARITGYDVQTLMNMTYVASRFDAGRRREGLSWSHHAELAALDPEAQDRLLARAESERLSVRDLREEIRRERRLAATGEEAEVQPADEPAQPEKRSDVVCPECGHHFHGRQRLRDVSAHRARAS